MAYISDELFNYLSTNPQIALDSHTLEPQSVCEVMKNGRGKVIFQIRQLDELSLDEFNKVIEVVKNNKNIMKIEVVKPMKTIRRIEVK